MASFLVPPYSLWSLPVYLWMMSMAIVLLDVVWAVAPLPPQPGDVLHHSSQLASLRCSEDMYSEELLLFIH